MSDLICPFCQQELVKDTPFAWNCPNEECIETDMMWGTANMWEELIRTRKALDAAKRRLMQIGYLNMSEHGLGSEKMMTDWCKTVALHGLKEIETALEQKEG